jgi:PPE-repeat protein
LLAHAANSAPATIAEAVSAETAAGGVGVTGLAGAVGPAGSAGFGGAPVLAGLGQASTVGGLSVPAGWSAATPATSSGASALAGSGWAVAPEEAAPVGAVPAGMPAVATVGKSLGFGGPRYGFKPTVMPKMVLV